MSIATGMAPEEAQTLIAERFSTERPHNGLADTLVRLGYIDAEAAPEIESDRNGRAFGATAVALGRVTREQLEFALGVHLGFLLETDEPTQIPRELVVARNPYSKSADEFRALRTQLCAGADASRLSPLAVTGALPAAAFTAVNLAASFAQLGKKTLMIDASLRRPALARVFGARQAPGVSDVVSGVVEFDTVRKETLIRNLSLLPAGAAPPDPQRVLADPAFERMLGHASGGFDIIVILTDPVETGSSCEFVWAVSGSALIVARKNETRLRDLEEIKSALRRTETRLAGAALLA